MGRIDGYEFVLGKVSGGISANAGLVADHQDDWVLTGSGALRSAGSAPDSNGLLIRSCSRFQVSNIEIFGFENGLIVDGESTAGKQVSESRITDIRSVGNATGLVLKPGFLGEYITITGAIVNHNEKQGVFLGAGNVNFIGGQVSYNGTGVFMDTAFNGQHGTMLGVSLNHNTKSALYIKEVKFGYNFVGCEFYDNSDGLPGIVIENSRGINISNGTIGCNIKITADPKSPVAGYNRISGNYIAKGMTLTGNGSFLARENFNREGLSEINN